MSATLDKDILATLEPEERAAIEAGAGGDTAADAEALARIANGAGADADEDDGDDSDEIIDADGNPVAAPGAAPAAAPAPTPAPAGEVAPAAAAPTAPVVDADAPREYVSTLPADHDTKLAELKERSEALKLKFREGEIDADQFAADQEALSEERAALSEARIADNISRQMHERQIVQDREKVVTSLFQSATSQGIDYEKDADRFAELQATMQAVSTLKAWAGRSFSATLTEAHRRVMLANGIAPGEPAPTPAPAAAAPAPASRKPPLDAAPKTLAQVPGGEGAGDVGGNEFSDIDRLEGDALEDAINRMTPVQRERYQRGL